MNIFVSLLINLSQIYYLWMIFATTRIVVANGQVLATIIVVANNVGY